MSDKTVVRVYLPEQENTFKTILLLATDKRDDVINKINKKLRRSGPGVFGFQSPGGPEKEFGASEQPFKVYSNVKGTKLLFRMKTQFPKAAAAKAPAPAVEDSFSSEPKDEFDKLLEKLQDDIGADSSFDAASTGAGSFPLCSSCGEPIVGTPLMAFGMPWHPEHLGCVVCGQPFINGRKVIEGDDGNAYCEADFIEKFAVRCDTCKKPIIGECIQAVGKNHHPACFKCVHCKDPLQGAFFEHEGKIFCENHYYKNLGLLCPECDKPIFGKCVNAKGVRYHPEHFKCSFCKKQLAGNAYYRHKEKVYCKDCSLKLYG